MSRLERYTLASTDLLLCAATLGTAAPYAWRHLQSSLAAEEGKWGHRLIALLESIPLGIGFLVGVIERIWIHYHPMASSEQKQREPLHSSRVQTFETEDQKQIKDFEQPKEQSSSPPVLPATEHLEQPKEQSSSPLFVDPILPADGSISDIAALPKPSSIPTCASWRTRALTVDECARKALKNLEKARRHHILDDLNRPRGEALESVQSPDYFDITPIPAVEELTGMQKLSKPLSFSISHAERWSGAGIRNRPRPRTPHIEDAHFAKMLGGDGRQPHGCYFGLFDGHLSSAVAQFAAALCKDNFETFLAATGGNTHQALELLVEWVQEEIKNKYDIEDKDPRWLAGTTVTLGFIDSQTGIATVATIADAETSRYTVGDDGSAKLLPLSPLLSWKDAKEKARARKARASVYADRLDGCLAVSRALGDCRYGEALSHKPKITQCRLQPGQILVVACDGLREDAYNKLKKSPDQHIAEQIAYYQKNGDSEGRSLAEVLVASAERYSTDDITAMAIEIG